jgi:2-hydroxy-3-keto-5-methylthiopentenyl-1-phosphate phosphatase
MTSIAPLTKVFNITVLVLGVLFPIYLDAQPAMTHKQSRIFILDFDGTITTKDTISVVAKSAISFHLRNGKDMTATWEGIVKDYGRDYEAFVGEFRPVKEARKTVDEEVAFYRALRSVEERSFERVGRRGLFAGIGEVDWERFGEEAVRNGDVTIRRGSAEFIRNIGERGAKWGVVSVNFSRAFVRGVLGTIDSDIKKVDLRANEPDENGILKGPMLQDGNDGELMTTSDAKLSAMKELLTSLGGSKANEVVYIGDSGTDIECLLEDGVTGIIISDDGNSSLLQTMKRIGVGISPIDKNYQKEKEAKGVVYLMRDFSEIIRSSFLR